MANLKRHSKRLLIPLWFAILFFVIIIVKLGYVQLVKHNDYSRQANSQRQRDERLLAKRGNIFDANGEKLAVTIEKETVFATPYLIKNPTLTAQKLATILKMPSAAIHSKLTKPKGFVFLKRKVGKATADKVRKLKIEGLGLYKENERYYPSGRLASQLVGIVGLDNEGLSGLEMKYDKFLKGRYGRLKDERDAFGQTIPGTKGLYLKPKDGNSLVLTLNRDIQYKAQLELKNAIKEWEAASGSVVVLNPQNGEILAMTSVPDFDLNKFSKAGKESQKNQPVVSVYEPGSTLKIIAATAAVEEKIYTRESSFYLPPTLNVAGKNIGEAHRHEAVNYTLAQIISESSNVGISKVGLAVGKQRLYKYFKSFGLLENTGIDYPGEVSGFVPKPKHWYGPTIATVAFGQGIAVSPLQLARAYSVVANGGWLYRPYIVKKIVSSSKKTVKTTRPERLRRVMSQKAAFEGTLMLEKVVSDGTGAAAAVKGYAVAGKTGTAQKANVGVKGYGKSYISSFIGFAPAENAKVLVLVVVDSPKKAIYGSQVAAPAFKNIMEFALHELKIPPQ